jgi:hypothetical protein
MEPTLYAGDRAIFRYLPEGLKESRSALGKIILIRRREEQDLLTVKRLIKTFDTGLWVEGDNPASSTDSRSYLTISPDEVVGIFLFRYRRSRRRRDHSK